MDLVPVPLHHPAFGPLTWDRFFWKGSVDLPLLGGLCGLTILHGGAAADEPPTARQVATFERFRRSLTPAVRDQMKRLMYGYWQQRVTPDTPVVDWMLRRSGPPHVRSRADVRGPEDVWAGLTNPSIVLPDYDFENYERPDPREVVSVEWVWGWTTGNVRILFVDGKPLRAAGGDDYELPPLPEVRP